MVSSDEADLTGEASGIGVRVFSFPVSRSVGWLHWGTVGHDSVEAQGAVEVPNGTGAELYAHPGAALAFLDALPADALYSLYLWRGRVIGDDLRHLRRLTGLQLLLIWDATMEEAAWPHLAALTHLPYLSLVKSHGVGDNQLGFLTGLTSLRSLTIEGMPVTDAGLAHLAHLSELKLLSLEKTAITDAGLPHLAALTNLAHLYLADTGITDAGRQGIQTALPTCTIH